MSGRVRLTRHEIYDKVDSSNLVHELDTPREKHALARLDFIIVEDLPDRLLVDCIFQFDGG